MSGTGDNSNNRLIDQICEQFEEAWLPNNRSDLEPYLARIAPVQRGSLLQTLLEIDIALRIKNRAPVDADDYRELGDEAVAAAHRILEQQFDQPTQVLNSSLAESSVDSMRMRDTEGGFERASHAPKKAFSNFGDYELLEEVARGGMGVVYKARQKSLNRIVALKMILSGQLAGEEEIQRFRSEAEAAAKLDHPGIVPIYEIDEHDGRQFFSMGFVDGISLQGIAVSGPLPPTDAARLTKKIADAIAYAHANGVIHRDLKPGNVLIGANGEPKVTDFGLAKSVDRDSDLTATGQVLGTPSWMPPEQASGQTSRADERADVYSLGAILYYLITGRPPFQAASVADTLRQVLDNEPVSPRQLNPSIPRDLETICLKAMRKELQARYQTATELAQDLNRWLKGEPIVARRVNRVERVWKWSKRRPVVAGLVASIIVITVFGSVLLWERQNASYARGLFESLMAAEPQEVPRILSEIDGYQYWTKPLLNQVLRDESDNSKSFRSQLHARLALVQTDESLVPRLVEDLLDSQVPDIGNIRAALARAKMDSSIRLWDEFRNVQNANSVRFRAGLGLILLAQSTDEFSIEDLEFIVGQLAATNAVYQPQLWTLLVDIDSRILQPLEEIFKDSQRSENERLAAANALVHFAPEVARLARLMSVATPAHFQVLYDAFDRIEGASLAPFRTLATEHPAKEMSAEQRIEIGKRRAAAGIVLLRYGDMESVLNVLRFDDDPEAMTQFVHRCRAMGVTASELLELLRTVDDRRGPWGEDRRKIDDIPMYAILLALGEFEFKDLPEPRQVVVARLAEIYARDPSSSVHSASGWLLRHWGYSEIVASVDQTPIAYDPNGHREWFVSEINVEPNSVVDSSGSKNKIYFTFVVFQPGSYLMGSPKWSADRDSNEQLQTVALTRPIAVTDREITWGQFDSFDDGNHRKSWTRQFAPILKPLSRELTPADPAFGVNWFEAVAYCRWLTDQMGLPESEQCYAADPLSNNSDPGVGWVELPDDTLWPVELDRGGFRLLTEAEWEYVCRSGTGGSYSFGEDKHWLSQYASYLTENSVEWSNPAAQLRPNPRGLFDIHGNLSEWCHNWYVGTYDRENATDPTGPPRGSNRAVRGGSWGAMASNCRSSNRDEFIPSRRNSSHGLRIARSLSSEQH